MFHQCPAGTLAKTRDQAAGDRSKLERAQYLRFTSPERTPHPETTWQRALVSRARAQGSRAAKQAIVVLRSGTRWLQPQLAVHDLQPHGDFGVVFPCVSRHSPPVELERSDYAVSANIGRTISACRQAVVDIRCLHRLLKSRATSTLACWHKPRFCYAYLASAHDPR